MLIMRKHNSIAYNALLKARNARRQQIQNENEYWKRRNAPINTQPDRILITQGKMTKTLSWWCPVCHIPHNIAVRAPGDKIPLAFKEDYWLWDGCTKFPTIGNECVDLPCGHNYINDGKLRYHNGPTLDLTPVNKWPTLKTKHHPFPLNLIVRAYQLTLKKPLKQISISLLGNKKRRLMEW